MPKSILLFGDLRDPHISLIRNQIREKDQKVEVFSRYNPDCKVSLSFDNEPSLNFEIEGRNLSSKEIGSIWWREKPFRLFQPNNPLRNSAQEFSGREWRSLLSSLITFIPDAKWMNNVKNQYSANFKPNQLLWAQKAGLEIPKTTFTNNSESVKSLLQNTQETIYKTFSGYIFPDAKAIFTTKISQDTIKGKESSIAYCPGIYQEYKDKKYELRVTFVGDKLFSVKIDSQKTEKTKTDWRENQEINFYSNYSLPTEIGNKLLRFIHESKLVYGTIDLIVSKDNEYIFLECNPAGQWLWIENFTNIPISKAVSNWLIVNSETTDNKL